MCKKRIEKNPKRNEKETRNVTKRKKWKRKATKRKKNNKHNVSVSQRFHTKINAADG